MLAGVYAVVGHHPDAGRAVAAVLSAAALLLMFVSWRTLLGYKAGLWFLALGAIHVQVVHIIGWIYTENVTIPLIALFFYCHVRGCRNGFSNWTLVAIGVTLGLLSLSRSALLPFAALYVIWLLFRLPKPMRLRGAALSTVLMVLVIAPWTVRNYYVQKGFVPISMFGRVLATTNNDLSGGEVILHPPDIWQTRNGPVNVAKQLEGTTPVQRDAVWRRAALTWIREHPDKFLARMTWKLFLTFTPIGQAKTGVLDLSSPKGNACLAAYAAYAVYLVICVLGYLRARRVYGAELFPILAFLVTMIPTILVTIGTPRLLLPLAPFLLGLFCLVLAGWRPSSQHAVMSGPLGGQRESPGAAAE
jgi:4-amino-4-deoxy-L-arabinose transferase-like glycosyltransferase